MCFSPTSQSPSCPIFEGPPDDASVVDVVDAAVIIPDATVDAGNVTTLASGLDDANAIVVDTTTVYWTSKYRFAERCAKTGCNNTPTVIANSPSASAVEGIVVDSSFVYTSSTNFIERCPIGGCSVPTILGFTGVVRALALDGLTLYWGDLSGSISSCATAGCGNNPTIVGTGSGFPAGLALDSTDVYWTSSTAGNVYKCPKTGCSGSPTIVASNQTFLQGIAVDSTALYWADGSAVLTCSKSNCVPTALVSNQTAPTSIVLDGANVYWTDTLAGTIMKCAKTGCGGNATVIAAGQTDLRKLAIDATTAYWTVKTAVRSAPLN
ncbi:hypothetical protein BH09MYX1_BH09MYX1_02930 [soil metagenome]